EERAETIELGVPADERIADQAEDAAAEPVDECLHLRGKVGDETAGERHAQLTDPQPERGQDTSCTEAWIAGDAEEQGLEAETGNVCALRLLGRGRKRVYEGRGGVVETECGERDTLVGGCHGCYGRFARCTDPCQRPGDCLWRDPARLQELVRAKRPTGARKRGEDVNRVGRDLVRGRLLRDGPAHLGDGVAGR